MEYGNFYPGVTMMLDFARLIELVHVILLFYLGCNRVRTKFELERSGFRVGPPRFSYPG